MAEKVPEHEKEQEIQIDEAQSDPPVQVLNKKLRKSNKKGDNKGKCD